MNIKLLKKIREIKAYYKAKKKEELERKKIVFRYEELKWICQIFSIPCEKEKKFRDSEEYKKLQEYKSLKGSSEIKEFYSFKKSKEYANFLNTHGSARLSRYNELKEYLASDEFRERKIISSIRKDLKKMKCSNSFRNMKN